MYKSQPEVYKGMYYNKTAASNNGTIVWCGKEWLSSSTWDHNTRMVTEFGFSPHVRNVAIVFWIHMNESYSHCHSAAVHFQQDSTSFC